MENKKTVFTDHMLSQIERAAEGATPGPWLNVERREYPGQAVIVNLIVCDPERPDDYDQDCDIAYLADESKGDNHSFIAIANPKTVLDLVTEIRRLRSALIERTLPDDGDECAHCGGETDENGMCKGER